MSEFDDLDVAVVGMAARFAGADDLERFWRMLVEGRDGTRLIDRDSFLAAGGTSTQLDDPDLVLRCTAIDGIGDFDAEYFGVNPADAQLMDPQHRLFLETAYRALEHAGHDPDDPQRAVGVYAGSGLPSYLLRNVMPWYLGTEAQTDPMAELMTVAAGTAPSTLATRVAYLLGLTGPAMTVATACSTSLVALHLACQDLIGLRTDVALAGGATLNPAAWRGYRWLDGGLMSRDGRCRAFDAAADGMAGGDGVGVVVLKRLADAVADGDTVYGVIAGSAVNNDGRRKVGFAAPSTQGQAEVIVAAHAAAGVSAEDIDYVEAHGTGTQVGDPVEVAALTAAFRSGPDTLPAGRCGLGAVKTNVGHTDTAAGVAGLIKTLLALDREQIPATLHYTAPNPLIDFTDSPFSVVDSLRPWPRSDRPRYAGVSSFGIGGTNAHVVVREAPEPTPRTPIAEQDGPQLLMLSARSADALACSCRELAAHLREHPGTDLGDVARTLDEGRRTMQFRAAIVAPSRAATSAAADLLDTRADAMADNPPRPSRSARPLVLLYSGAASTVAPEVVRELAAFSPPFADTVAEAARVLRPLLGTDLAEALYSGGVPDARDDPAALSSAAVVALEFALTALLGTFGITPATVLGHSLGEYAAASVAGVLGRGDTLETVVHRQRLLDAVEPDGAAEALLADPDDLGPLPDGVYLSVTTGPGSCVVSGRRAVLDTWLAEGIGERIPHRPLPAGYAVHCPHLEPAADALRALFESTARATPRTRWVSTVPGSRGDAESWVRHSIGPVDFEAALRTAAGRARPAFLEVGPGRALARAAKSVFGDETPSAATLPGPRHGALAALFDALGALWCAGVDVTMAGTRPSGARLIPLPGHPWNRKRYWMDPPGAPAVEQGDSSEPSPVPRPSAGAPRPSLAGPYTAPGTEPERRLARLCAAALGFAEVGMDDDVFALGADSLSALRLVQRVRTEFGAAPGVRDFLLDPKVRNLLVPSPTTQNEAMS
ncbi:type I polyketide synthase [Pseudonocardia spinosispora]|uniref:type I polyketide synthase n=1 Tax=Pseudonocardia spinosispora TaxID=103441 RepID=UPI000407ADE8|nr:type I polyketide synthase [Pseudonocardia spinosispora]